MALHGVRRDDAMHIINKADHCFCDAFVVRIPLALERLKFNESCLYTVCGAYGYATVVSFDMSPTGMVDVALGNASRLEAFVQHCAIDTRDEKHRTSFDKLIHFIVMDDDDEAFKWCFKTFTMFDSSFYLKKCFYMHAE